MNKNCIACNYPREKFRDYQCPRCYCPQMIINTSGGWGWLNEEDNGELLDHYRNKAKQNNGNGYL